MNLFVNFIVKNWLLVLVFVLSGAMLAWPLVGRRFSKIQSIGTLRATQLINSQDALLLDIRETQEYEGGRLPNARHIPLSQLKERSGELAKWKNKPIVIYCNTGTRSGGAGSILEKEGFSEIYQLTGGFRAWKDANLPVQKA
jgi:rhodanese-related sulfurtransferase